MGATARVRMTPEDRRRQLVGIGLRKFVERPVQELSLDEVAAEAGVSRGLLFHYFPTKTDYHRAVVEAARRRVGRNVSPDAGVVGEAAVRQVVERFLDQVARRRASYVALVLGQAPIARAAGDDPVETVREHVAGVVARAADLPDAALPGRARLGRLPRGPGAAVGRAAGSRAGCRPARPRRPLHPSARPPHHARLTRRFDRDVRTQSRATTSPRQLGGSPARGTPASRRP